MSLEHFRVPETPESRTPRVLLLLLVIGLGTSLVRTGWTWLAFSTFGEAAVLTVAGGAVVYAVARYVRGRRTLRLGQPASSIQPEAGGVRRLRP